MARPKKLREETEETSREKWRKKVFDTPDPAFKYRDEGGGEQVFPVIMPDRTMVYVVTDEVPKAIGLAYLVHGFARETNSIRRRGDAIEGPLSEMEAGFEQHQGD